MGFMNRNEMIVFIKESPFARVTHPLFSADEYIYCGFDGRVYDENGYLFEDWYSEGPGRWAGIRERVGGYWEEDWKVKKN